MDQNFQKNYHEKLKKIIFTILRFFSKINQKKASLLK